MQRLIGIEEYSGGVPKARQEAEQSDANCGCVGVFLKPLISVCRLFVFDQRSLSSRIRSSTVGKGPGLSG
jgi:hypothetical protein